MKENEEVYTTDTGLPENAFRELAADEQYVPVMKPAHDQKMCHIGYALFCRHGSVDGCGVQRGGCLSWS